MKGTGNGSSSSSLKLAASALGATGITLGAFGAHALHATLVKRGMLDNWKTAVLYQLVHAVAVLGISAMSESSSSTTLLQYSGQLMTLGTTLFSGSIYMLCLGIGPKKIIGPTTPIGGMIMISGWIVLGFC